LVNSAVDDAVGLKHIADFNFKNIVLEHMLDRARCSTPLHTVGNSDLTIMLTSIESPADLFGLGTANARDRDSVLPPTIVRHEIVSRDRGNPDAELTRILWNRDLCHDGVPPNNGPTFNDRRRTDRLSGYQNARRGAGPLQRLVTPRPNR
jgi:hypothetical protein